MSTRSPEREVFRPQTETAYGSIDRAKQVARIGRQIGIFPTVKLIVDRLRPAATEHLHTIRHPRLRHPLSVTSHDVTVFDETLVRGANSLPPQLHQAINGQIILDIGANIGVTAALYASTYPKSQVIAIEPHPRNADLLRRNSSPYGHQIEVVEAALTLKPGLVPLDNPEKEFAHCFNGSYRFSEAVDQPPAGITTAHAISLGELSSAFGPQERIGLMKVDIEGVEKRLFESADMDLLLPRINVLAVETHDRITPGCQQAVTEAARRHGLLDIGDSPYPYTRFFALTA